MGAWGGVHWRSAPGTAPIGPAYSTAGGRTRRKTGGWESRFMSSSRLEGPAAAAAASGEVSGRLGGNRTGAAAVAGGAATSSADRPSALDGRDAVAVADPDAD